MSLPIHRLFILGAGFSRFAGFPLGPELLDKARRRVRDHFRGAGWEGALEEEIVEWQELYPGRVLNLESVLAYSHRKHFLRLIGSNEYFAHGSRSIVATRYAIQAILTSHQPQEVPRVYKEFVRRLTPHDTVMTFNYDTLLEQALEDVEKPYSLTPEWWLDDRSPEGGQHYSPRFVNLIKLHGSIDWYDRHYYDDKREYYASIGVAVRDDDPLFGPHPIVPTESLAKGPVSGYGDSLLARVVRVPDHIQHFPFAPSWSVVPFLLPPAYDKLLGSEPIRDLWQNMHRTRDAYSMITVIGYSMPEYDGYAYEALGRLLFAYQSGGDQTGWEQRRVPLQIISKASSEEEVFKSVPFLRREPARVYTKGFSLDSLDWLDWGDPHSSA